LLSHGLLLEESGGLMGACGLAWQKENSCFFRPERKILLLMFLGIIFTSTKPVRCYGLNYATKKILILKYF
jgi:hypothetical protein